MLGVLEGSAVQEAGSEQRRPAAALGLPGARAGPGTPGPLRVPGHRGPAWPGLGLRAGSVSHEFSERADLSGSPGPQKSPSACQ